MKGGWRGGGREGEGLTDNFFYAHIKKLSYQ